MLLLRYLSLYRAAIRLSAAALHAPPARVYPLPSIPAGRPQGWSDPLRHEVDRWLGDCDWLLLNDVETLQLAGHPTLAEAAAAPGGTAQRAAAGAW